MNQLSKQMLQSCDYLSVFVEVLLHFLQKGPWLARGAQCVWCRALVQWTFPLLSRVLYPC